VDVQTADSLAQKKCLPCEGGVEPVEFAQAQDQLRRLSGWSLTYGGKRIRKDWVVSDFMEAIGFFRQIAEIAEEDGHHPDLHLSQYRNVTVELWTHAIRGLSENDFIIAAKIDKLARSLKK